ncbi:MAG: hypothetical protein JO369_08615 [Paucibacter sp.]|nr:hypothetical protein [Roseateles sp.]
MSKKIIAAAILATIGVAAFAQGEGAAAPAAGASGAQWRKDHPRRAEVNARLANQNKRIDNEEKDGQINKAQAAKLHKQDRQIRQEERDMASQDHGHITKSEQKVLNQQENKTSKEIGK